MKILLTLFVLFFSSSVVAGDDLTDNFIICGKINVERGKIFMGGWNFISDEKLEFYFHNNTEQRVTKYSMAGELVYFYKTTYSKIEVYHGDNPDIEDPDVLIDRKNLSVFSTLDKGTQVYESDDCSLFTEGSIVSNMEKLQKKLIDEIKKDNLL